MKHFFTLVEFEYRKIWKRKSAILAMSVGLLVSILSVWGPLLGSTYINGKVSESNYEATFKDLQYAKDLNGRTLDTALLLEAAHAYAQIPPNTEIPYIGLEEYETYARPYSSIYGIAGRVYRASGEEFSYEEMAALTKRDANHFYEKRASLLKNTIANTTMSQTAKEHTLKTAEKVQTPFTYSNTEGYGCFLTLMQSTGILSAFVHSNMSFSSVCRGIHQPRRPASAFFPIWKGKTDSCQAVYGIFLCRRLQPSASATDLFPVHAHLWF